MHEKRGQAAARLSFLNFGKIPPRNGLVRSFVCVLILYHCYTYWIELTGHAQATSDSYYSSYGTVCMYVWPRSRELLRYTVIKTNYRHHIIIYTHTCTKYIYRQCNQLLRVNEFEHRHNTKNSPTKHHGLVYTTKTYNSTYSSCYVNTKPNRSGLFLFFS